MLHPDNFHGYLRWPADVPRTEKPNASRSKKSFYESLKLLEKAMHDAGISNYDIYCKLDFDFKLKRIVEMYDDTAVVIKWRKSNGAVICYACDHYLSASRNMQELAKAITLRAKLHQMHFHAKAV